MDGHTGVNKLAEALGTDVSNGLSDDEKASNYEATNHRPSVAYRAMACTNRTVWISCLCAVHLPVQYIGSCCLCGF